MKDELINNINKKVKQNKRLMTVSAFSLFGIDIFVMLLIVHAKHPQIINMNDTTLVKSFFRNFS